MLALFWVGLIVVFLAVLLVPILTWDKARRSLVLALRSLWLHKLRAFLSVLGIIIGTTSVIALMAFGEGSMHDALEDIKRQGATNIIVRSVKPSDDSATSRRAFVANYGLTYADYDRFRTIPDVIRMVPMRIFSHEVRYLERLHNARLVATLPQYSEVNQLTLVAGRFLIDEDEDLMRNVCVLAAGTADALFPFDDPLDRSVQIKDQYFRVVGVLAERLPTGGSGGSQAAEDYNHDVYIPLTTCKVRLGQVIISRTSGSRSGEQVQLHQVTLTMSDTDKVRPAGDVIRDLLQLFHQRADWAVTVPLDRLEEAERAKNRFTMLLVVIATISLVVGGIGIMNIMLATVTERTREIGIRRALGAKRRDITLQFLIEAVVQTTIGGLVGVICGLFCVWLIPLGWKFAIGPLLSPGEVATLPAKLHLPSLFLSISVAVSVGVLAGWYPARRAALLDPIEALRHD
jgi:putative ABC transport system permease protein